MSQCEIPSADDLVRNINPFDDEVSPKTYQEMVKSIKEDAFQPSLVGHNQAVSFMDANQTFAELFSYGSERFTASYSSAYVSEGEQLQLTSTGVGHTNQFNSVSNHKDSQFDSLLLESQCKAPSVVDLERNVIPFDDEVSPKTHQELIKEVACQHNQVSSSMDTNQLLSECLSHDSQHITMPHPSSYESQGEHLQLAASVANPPSSPSISQNPITCTTPGGIHNSEVEQTLSMDGSEVNVYFSSHNSASICQNFYGALDRSVPEVVKAQQRELHLQIKLPDNGM